MITVVVGAQYGSEGKGAVVAHLAQDYNTHVRVGGPNAGHTVWDGERYWKLQSVPCGFLNREALLVIGAGAVVDPEQLEAEIRELDAAGWNVRERLVVDGRATVITDDHKAGELGVDGRAHRLIGSTGKGVGLARMARINRNALLNQSELWCRRVCDVCETEEAELNGWAFQVVRDTAGLVCVRAESGDVLLEGTQGSGLSLTFGPWPFVTSADTNAAQLLADVGVPSWHYHVEVLLVARTYPIRVAGNSGPLENETSWEELDQTPERTTVTNKIRRVGAWDDALFARAVELNRPQQIALTFCDYLFPELYEADERSVSEHEPLRQWAHDLEERHEVSVGLLGVGPKSVHVPDWAVAW